jgi:acetyltransferase
MAARLTQIDYDREMAFVLRKAGADASRGFDGVVRLAADPDFERAEFAVIVPSPAQGRGLGRLLMRQIIAYARTRGIRELYGDVLAENERMRKLAAELGFETRIVGEAPAVLRVTKRL